MKTGSIFTEGAATGGAATGGAVFPPVYHEKTLFSRRDPAGQAERLAVSLPRREGTLYFCPSPLYGYGLETVLARLGPASAVLAVELEEPLAALTEKALPRAVREHPRFAYAGGAAAGGGLFALVRERWGGRAFRRVETLRLTGGWQLHAAAYDGLEAALRRDVATSWGNAMTLVRLGRRYIHNALKNLPLLARCPTINDLNFGGAPVLVLGAGPSLDAILPVLAKQSETKKPYKIIAVDTALRPLAEWGVSWDLAVALEAQHWNLRDFAGLSSCLEGETEKKPLAMDLSALPATGRLAGMRPYLFCTPWTELSFFGRLREAGLFPPGMEMPPLGSVGLTAVALALGLTSGPVVVAGLDLAFTLDRYHARSSPAHLDRLCGQTRLHNGLINAAAACRRGVSRQPSKLGFSVLTDPALKNYRDLFAAHFGGHPRLFDIAGPGLPLGVRTLSLDAALAVLHPPADGMPLPPPVPPQLYDKEKKMAGFVRGELERLGVLRAILTGSRPGAAPPGAELIKILEDCGYLWAHFPECAAAGLPPPVESPSFLKRVRVELDPCAAILSGVLHPGSTD